MDDRKRLIREHILERHAASWRVLSALTPDDASAPVYTQGEPEWTVHQIVAHLADSERGLLGQVQRLTAGQQTVPPDFDLNRWNRSAVRKREQMPLSELLEEILTAHEEVLRFLDQVRPEDLDLRGRHPSGGVLTAEGFFRRVADHRAEHAADIARALRERR